MNTQLKKGDKCQSPYGIAEIHSFGVETCLLKLPDGSFKSMHVSELTRIPTHAERMQAVLDIAWDVENRLEDNETVQLKVEAFVEFARHYCAMKDELGECVEYHKAKSKENLAIVRDTEKLMKGETP